MNFLRRSPKLLCGAIASRHTSWRASIEQPQRPVERVCHRGQVELPPRSTPASFAPQSSHSVRINKGPLAEGIATSGAFNLEAKLEPDCRLVVDVNRQFKPAEVEPVVG